MKSKEIPNAQNIQGDADDLSGSLFLSGTEKNRQPTLIRRNSAGLSSGSPVLTKPAVNLTLNCLK
ncbi:MAG: hypothetical protein HFG69_17390 [Hungatella sp.]|nr:hypothetical protein [Hungatella sp.]